MVRAIHESVFINWPDPTEEMCERPEFEAIWQAIKSWDVNVPESYKGYCGANGNHVRAILDVLKAHGIVCLQNQLLLDLKEGSDGKRE